MHCSEKGGVERLLPTYVDEKGSIFRNFMNYNYFTFELSRLNKRQNSPGHRLSNLQYLLLKIYKDNELLV